MKSKYNQGILKSIFLGLVSVMILTSIYYLNNTEEVEEMAEEVTIAKHNIDNEPNTPTKYGVRGIPTMLLFKDGDLKATKVGATTKSNILSWIKENI